MRRFLQPFPRRNKVLLYMVFSYLLALLLPLTVGCGAFLYFRNVMEEQIQKTNEQSLQRLRSISDANLQNIRSIGQLLVRSENLQRGAYLSQPYSSTDLVVLWKLQRESSTQMLANPLVENIYITFPQSGTVSSTEGLFYREDFSRYCETTLGISMEEWLEFCTFAGHNRFILFATGEGECRAAVFCKESSRPGGPGGVVGILLRDGDLRELLRSMSPGGDGEVLIAAPEGMQISSLEGGRGRLPLYAGEELPPLVYDREERVMIHQYPSAVNDWVYLSVTPDNIYRGPVKALEAAVGAYVLICLAFGLLLISSAVRKQYTPIKQLMGALRDRLGQTELPDNGYGALENSVSRLLDSLMDKEEALSRQNKTLRDHAAARIITGKLTGREELENARSWYGIELEGERFAVMLFLVEDFGDLTPEEAVEDSAAALQLVHLVLLQAAVEVLSEGFSCETAEIGDLAACVVGMAKEEDNVEPLRKAAEQLCRFMKERFRIAISVSIGRLCHSLFHLSQSYQEAVKGVEYIQAMRLERQILLPGDLDRQETSCWQLHKYAEVERVFLNYMMAGDYQEARNYLKKAADGELRTNLAGMKVKKSLLLNLMLVGLGKIPVATEELFPDSGEVLGQLCEAGSIPILEERCNAVFDRLVDYGERQGEKEPSRCEEIMEYVRANYRDPNLSISSIAETLSVSVSYLSRSFKSGTGMGLLDYIHTLRIAECKELLKTTRLSVKEISQRTGYYSGLTMSRAFRRYEGITPSEYRSAK